MDITYYEFLNESLEIRDQFFKESLHEEVYLSEAEDGEKPSVLRRLIDKIKKLLKLIKTKIKEFFTRLSNKLKELNKNKPKVEMKAKDRSKMVTYRMPKDPKDPASPIKTEVLYKSLDTLFDNLIRIFNDGKDDKDILSRLKSYDNILSGLNFTDQLLGDTISAPFISRDKYMEEAMKYCIEESEEYEINEIWDIINTSYADNTNKERAELDKLLDQSTKRFENDLLDYYDFHKTDIPDILFEIVNKLFSFIITAINIVFNTRIAVIAAVTNENNRVLESINRDKIQTVSSTEK